MQSRAPEMSIRTRGRGRADLELLYGRIDQVQLLPDGDHKRGNGWVQHAVALELRRQRLRAAAGPCGAGHLRHPRHHRRPLLGCAQEWRHAAGKACGRVEARVCERPQVRAARRCTGAKGCAPVGCTGCAAEHDLSAVLHQPTCPGPALPQRCVCMLTP